MVDLKFLMKTEFDCQPFPQRSKMNLGVNISKVNARKDSLEIPF